MTQALSQTLLTFEEYRVYDDGSETRYELEAGKKNEDRVYRYKRSEYAARGVVEYWIIDPIKSQVMILMWVEGLYEEKTLSGVDRIQSEVFRELNPTTEQVFAVR
jgi:Uma2 family endonuclease